MSREAPTLGWSLISWIETLLCHGVGDVEGQELRLDLERCQFIADTYQLTEDPTHPSGWRRTYNREVLSRAKGWAKSEVAGMLACAEALAPVRFDHFAVRGEVSPWGYRYEKGEPVGRPVTRPEILCVATEEGQAGNTYEHVHYMLSTGAVAEEYGLARREHVGETRISLPGGGTIEPISAAARSKDGGRSTFVVFDETHLWITLLLRALYDTIRRNLGKRGLLADPWSLDTTTMYKPGEGSVAEASHDYAKAVASGKIKDARLLFDHREASKGLEDLDDEEDLLVALHEAYGDAAAWQDLGRKIVDLHAPDTDPSDWERYSLNRGVSASDQFMPKDDWEECANPGHRPTKRRLITAGFDGSRWRDATAIYASDGVTGHLFKIGIWERPPDAKDDWEVPRDEVHAAVARMFADYKVVRFYCDPPEWDSEVNDWAARYGDKVVVKWPTYRDRPMAAALKRILTDVRARQVTHDADPQLTDHAMNARKHIKRAADDPDGMKERVLIRKPVRGGPKKIDAFMAATLSHEARADAIAAGEMTRKRHRTASF